MIARTWHGVVQESMSDEYLKYLKKTGVSGCQEVEGNQGVFVFRRSEQGQTHYLMLTLWDSFESIRKFAGNDFEKARYYPEDKDYLVELEPFVTHYEVLVNPGGDS